jgi:hypothetical protein
MGHICQGGYAQLEEMVYMDKGEHASFWITSGYTLAFEVYIYKSILIYELWIIMDNFLHHRPFFLVDNDGKKLPTQFVEAPRIFL